jgi:hypothetical protein
MITEKQMYELEESIKENKRDTQYLDLRYLLMCIILILTGNFILNIVLILKIIWGIQ